MVDHISGEIEIDNTNGNVTANHISGSAILHALNGKVLATLDKITPDKAMSFSSLNGDIDVTLPADTESQGKAEERQRRDPQRFRSQAGRLRPAADCRRQPLRPGQVPGAVRESDLRHDQRRRSGDAVQYIQWERVYPKTENKTRSSPQFIWHLIESANSAEQENAR